MKIAHVVPVMNTVPPKKYGGIEEVVTQLAIGQTKAGHEVTLFAAKGSKPPAPGVHIIEAAPYPTTQRLKENRTWEVHELLQAVSMQGQFDLLHLHYEPIIARAVIDDTEQSLLDFLHVPTVVTFHNITNISRNIKYYRAHKSLWRHQYAFISNSHRKPLKFFPHAQVVYNGIAVEDFPLGRRPGEYLLFMGRITKVKGILEAIRCAKLSGKKLIIAAKVDPVDQEFFQTKVKHLIDGKQIVYVGEVNFKQKIQWYKNALCTLFPISWEEPFGLVMVESMACGTPVIAFNHGSVPELVRHGKTGFVVRDVPAMVAAIAQVHRIKRSACRRHVERSFSAKKMVQNYLQLYRAVISGIK